MRGRDINIELECPKYFTLIDADVLFDLLHFVLVKWFSSICSVVHNVVEAVAKRL
jgi:hypothetical protein